MKDVLQVNSLSKTYADFRLDQISFTLPMGYIMGLIGPNGSGKTTTIKSILNMTKADSGTISVFGKDYIQDEQTVKQDIGIVLDSSYFVEDWRIRDVEKAFSLFYPKWDNAGFFSRLSRFGIAKEKKVKELSKGMQMKLMLACSFSYGAKLLILDEPTGGLDPLSRDELLEILADYIADGEHSVLFSTHITSDLEKIADYITYLNLGSLVFTGSKEDFIESYRLVTGERSLAEGKLGSKLIGTRMFSTGFEALIKKEDIPYASGAHLNEATIDNIIVFTSRQNEKKGADAPESRLL